jgi:hypothetical protein
MTIAAEFVTEGLVLVTHAVAPRYLFPRIVHTGNLGVLSAPFEAISSAIRVAEPIGVLRLISSSS